MIVCSVFCSLFIFNESYVTYQKKKRKKILCANLTTSLKGKEILCLRITVNCSWLTIYHIHYFIRYSRHQISFETVAAVSWYSFLRNIIICIGICSLTCIVNLHHYSLSYKIHSLHSKAALLLFKL